MEFASSQSTLALPKKLILVTKRSNREGLLPHKKRARYPYLVGKKNCVTQSQRTPRNLPVLKGAQQKQRGVKPTGGGQLNINFEGNENDLSREEQNEKPKSDKAGAKRRAATQE